MKISLLLICCFFLFSCTKDPAKQEYVDFEKKDFFDNVVSYGQEVYYFKYVGADFGNVLAAFLKKYSDLEVASVAVNTTDHGGTKEYFVVFRQKKKC